MLSHGYGITLFQVYQPLSVYKIEQFQITKVIDVNNTSF